MHEREAGRQLNIPGSVLKNTDRAMETAVRLSWWERINFRILLFAAAVLLPIGAIVYIYADTLISHGVWEKNDSRYGKYLLVDLKSMSDFELDAGSASSDAIPKRYRELDGQRVMLKGEMVASKTLVGAQSDFDLCYSIQKCCFSGSPKIQHFVKCQVVPGREKRAQYQVGIVSVVGKLKVGVVRDAEGRIESVYRLEVESVEQG